jgi:hypothetical protein
MALRPRQMRDMGRGQAEGSACGRSGHTTSSRAVAGMCIPGICPAAVWWRHTIVMQDIGTGRGPWAWGCMANRLICCCERLWRVLVLQCSWSFTRRCCKLYPTPCQILDCCVGAGLCSMVIGHVLLLASLVIS